MDRKDLMRPFVRLYEEFTDSSAFEHINVTLIKRVYIDSEEDGKIWVAIHYWQEDTADYMPFTDHKEAQRFIKRVAGV